MKYVSLLALALSLAACSQKPETQSEPAEGPFPAIVSKTDLDPADKAIEIVKTLSDDAMMGRESGTDGIILARNYLRQEITAMDVFDYTSEQQFTFGDDATRGSNLLARIDGETPGEGPLLILTAHYDHVGTKDGEVYNGADDNASGVAALIAVAESFTAKSPTHDMLFVWFDAEEKRLQGARNFVKDNTGLLSRPTLNLNLDMVSQNKDGILYMAGAHHTPALKPLAETAAKGTGVTLKFGHDHPDDGPNDWTLQSDHGPFHLAGIPFAYFGVEDHPHYHKESDEFETLPLDVYRNNIKLLTNAAHIFDENLARLARPAKTD